MAWRVHRLRLFVLLCLCTVIPELWAQTTAASDHTSPPPLAPQEQEAAGNYELKPGEDPENRLGVPFLRHLATDQKNFWTSPARARGKDLPLLLPFVATSGLLIASDSWISRQVPDKPNQLKQSLDLSNYAAYSMVGIAGGAFLLGQVKGNEHLKEAGLLSGEAAINGTAIDYIFKGISQRPRPLIGDGNGTFFQGGSSFASEHATVAWSVASVFAHEYPGPLTKFFAYGLASAVTLTRVTSKEHFPTDAFVGSALGWFIGRQVYRAHHDTELGGSAWGDFLEGGEKGPRGVENMGSPYVPVDSWVYPVLDRLAGLGYVKSAHAGMRPWTRMECARLVEEAGEDIAAEESSSASQLYNSLADEFSAEIGRLNGDANVGADLDSVYSRVTGISGTPLRDGYNFGQTIINDYGRPYGEGFNNVTGVISHAVFGPVFISFRGEYQHAPAVASDPASVLNATATAAAVLPLPNGTPVIDRFRLLESTIGVTFKNTEISFGKQSLWLGPGEGGPLLFSDNAEPIPMFHIDQIAPLYVPGLSRLFGPIRTEFFIGRLSGLNWISGDNTLFGPNISNQPFIHGEKLSFKPNPNLEFGFGVTTLFGGPGLPVTWKNFVRTLTNNGFPGTSSDPGDRRSTFDLSYRVPYLRDYLTIYADSLVEDEVSPLGSTRPSMRLGTYFPKIPRVPKLELRLEGVYTDVPGQAPGGFIYWNGRYRSGYTNNGYLLASWIGRQGRGGQAWATYWLTGQNKIQVSYRHAETDKAFIGGGRLNDFAARGELRLTSSVALVGGVQYERWNFPVLRAEPTSNFTTSVELKFHAQRWHRK